MASGWLDTRWCRLGAATAALAALALLPAADGPAADRAAGTPATSTRPGPADTGRRGLRLSEVKLDGVDGSEDWWVELYNPSGRAADARGVTVVLNGKVVCTIGAKSAAGDGQAVEVPPKGLLVVRVPASKPAAARKSAPRRPTITVVPPLPKRAPAPARRPGCCALFASPKIARENLVDYVAWGRPRGRAKPRWPHESWAVEARLWGPFDAVPIGLDPRPGERSAPPRGASLCRYDFSGRRTGPEMWATCPAQYATPGEGNRVAPPQITWPFGGHAADGPLPIGCRWTYGIPSLVAYGADDTAARPYHFQIAADPMFSEIVFDKRLGDGANSIPQGRLKVGSYWVRVRYDSPKLSTDWSNPLFFTYR